jgi:predicted PurR-regulated permease PerM
MVYDSSKQQSKWPLAIFLIVFGIFLLYTLQGFIVAFLGALIFYVLFRPFMMFLSERKKWKKGLAAITILLLSLLVVVLPIILVSYMIVPKVTLFFSDTSMVMKLFRDIDEKITSFSGIRLLSEQNLSTLQQKATGFITDFLSASFSIFSSLAIMYLMLFYLLTNYGKLEKAIESYLPFNEKNIRKFSHELEAQTFSNAVGMPLYALLQGIVAAIGYWVFGLDQPIFWGVMTGFFSFVPVVGTFIIWLPAAAFMLSEGHTWQGLGLGLFGLIIISMVDNFFLFAFQKKFANVHPLVTILGFVLGVSLFGIPGIIFGPLLISYFLILLKIYKEEFIERTEG